MDEASIDKQPRTSQVAIDIVMNVPPWTNRHNQIAMGGYVFAALMQSMCRWNDPMMKSRVLMRSRRIDIKRGAEIFLTKRLCRGPNLTKSKHFWREEVFEVAESYTLLTYFHIFAENLGWMIVMT